MWRSHQAVQSTVKRWMLRRHHHTSIGGYPLLSSLRCLGGTSFDATEKLLQRPSILSRSNVLPSTTRYYGDINQRISNPLLISCHAFSTRGGNRPRGPDMKGLQSVEEVVVTAYEHLDVMSRRDVSAFWTCISKLMTKRQPRQRSKSSNNMGDISMDDMRHMLYTIFNDTTHGIEDCNIRGLTETILGMARIVKILREQGKKRGGESCREILRELLLNKGMKPNEELFQFFANVSINTLDQFDARCLSNLAYAYALIDYVPEFDDGSDLFDHIAKKAGGKTDEFNPQDISNMVWAYATVNKPQHDLFEAIGDQVVAVKDLNEFNTQSLKDTVWAYATAGISHPKLFEKVANHIVLLDTLHQFKPQELSNTLWAYATAGISHQQVFEKVANHIVLLDTLHRFKPQELSNTVWAYATAEIPHPKLFEKVANHIVKLDSLDQFTHPQDISNTVWAYATAGIHHPKLFEKMANHIVESDNLDRFEPQALKDTVWAFATAQVSHPKLFQKVAKAAIQRKEEFNISQDVANLLWAYATMGIVDNQLFSSFVPTAAKLIDSYNNQELANIGWAYAVANVDAPTLFNDHFTNACVEKEERLEKENLFQLHQWHLWQTKEKSNTGLPEELQGKCFETFIDQDPTPSKLQDDVVAQLTSIGLEPKEEVLMDMDSGYRIDTIVEVNGKTIGVEVDGPYHFIGRSRSPLARTILKRRQVPAIDGIELVSIPYWEWDKLGKDEVKKQEYLRERLGLVETEQKR